MIENWRFKWYRQRARITALWWKSRRVADWSPMEAVLPAAACGKGSRYWRERQPEIERLRQDAAAMLAGQVRLLSAGAAKGFGTAPFWRRHPISGAALPGGIRPYFPAAFQDGDIWLAQYAALFQHAPHLAMLGALDGDPRYAVAIGQWLDSWASSRHPAASLYWRSGLDAALRCAALLYADSLAGSQTFPDKTRALIARLAIAGGLFLEESTRQLTYNHTIVEAYGLLLAGLALRNSEQGRAWIRQGLDVLDGQWERQFFGDGFHVERSPGYMRLVVEVYLHARILGAHAELSLPAGYDGRLERACDALAQVCGEQGRMPNLSDDSDLGLFGENRGAGAAMALAAVLFGRGDFKALAGDFPPVAYWLLGEEGYEKFQSLEAARGTSSGQLPESGFHRMESAGAVMWITAGCERTPRRGHAHADALSFELWAHGSPLIVDAGTYFYNGFPEWRSYFRGTPAHNTVSVDGLDQGEPRPGGNFGWARYPTVKLHEWRTLAEVDFFDAAHDGYSRLPGGVTHRRQVLFVKPCYWLLLDKLTGEGEHELAAGLQFAPLAVRWENARQVVVPRDWGRLEVRQLTPGCQASLVSGQEAPIRGWVSRGYGHKEEAPSLEFRHRGPLPFQFCTLLTLVERDAACEAELTEAAGGVLEVHVALGGRQDRIRLYPDSTIEFAREGRKPLFLGKRAE